MANTYAFRIEADASVLEREYARAQGATTSFQSATEAFSASMAKTGAPIDAFTASLAKVSGGTSSAERATRSAAAAFSSLVAGLDPVEAAYQKAARAEAMLTDLTVRGIEVTERQRRAVDGLRSDYDRLAQAEIAAAQARQAAAAQGAQTSAADEEAAAWVRAEIAAKNARRAASVAARNEGAVTAVYATPGADPRQAVLNSLLGAQTGPAAKSAADSADVFGQALDGVRAKLLPLVAAQQTYLAKLKELAEAEAEDAAHAADYAEQRRKLEEAYARQVKDLTGVTAAERDAAEAAERHGREVQALVATLNGYVAATDPVAASLARVAQAERELAQAQAQGLATPEQVAAVGRLRAAHEDLAAGTKAAEKAAAAEASQVERLVASLNGYVHALDPVAASLAKVTQAETELAAAQARGIATPEQIAAVGQMRRAHEDLEGKVKQTGNAFGLADYQVRNAKAQFVDFGVQISSGGGILLPLIQQAPQLIDALDGSQNALRIVREIFTPMRVGAIALAGGVAAVTVAAISQANELARVQTQLKGIEAGYRGTAEAAIASARSVARSGAGISVSDALSAQVALARGAANAEIRGLDYTDLTKQVADLAARLGVDFGDALKTVTGAMGKTVTLVDYLKDRGYPGMTESLRLTVQRLDEAGEHGTALNLVMSRARETFDGAAKEGGPLQEALRSLKDSFGSIWDDIKHGLANAGTPLLTWMAEVVSQARKIREANLNGQGRLPDDGMQPEYDAAGNATGRRIPLVRPDGSTAGTPTGTVTATSGRVPADYRASIDRGADIAGVDRELMYRVFALGEQSRRAADGSWPVSPVGARGGMQVMPGTFAEMARKYGIQGGIDNDNANAEAGARYMRELLDRFPGNVARAAAGYNAGPNRPEATLRAIEQGAYARRVTDGYTGSGVVTVNAQTARIEGAGPAMRPDFDQAEARRYRPSNPSTPTTDAYDVALGIARGAPGSPQLSGATPEARGASAVGLIRQLREGLDAAGPDQPIDTITQKIRELNQVVERGKGTQALFLRGMTEQADAAQILDPRLKAIAEALATYRDRMRAAGEEETDAGRQAAITQKLREMGAAYLAASAEAARTGAAQDRLGEAWGRGREAVSRLAAEEKAREVVRAAGKEGTAEEAKLVSDLADAYQRVAQQQAENVQRATNQNTRDTLAYLEKERDLIGATADERERELAAFRARQQGLAARQSESTIQETEGLARAQVDATRRNQQLTNSTTALRDAFSDVGSTIQSSIVGALASGEAKAVSLGNVLRAVQQGFLGKAIELIVTNPLQNSSDGGTRGTLWGATGGSSGGIMQSLSRLFSPSGGTSATTTTATPGSSTFSLGDVSSWGSGIGKLWNGAKSLFGLGSSAAGASSALLSTGLSGDALASAQSAMAASGLANSGGTSAMMGASAGGGLGETLGGIGMGYSLGSTLGGFVAGGAKNPAKMQNAQTGAAVGAIIGSFIPIPVVGTLVGGAIGGLIGGMFGPKGQFQGGVGQIAVNDKGQFYYAGSTGKKYNEGEVSRDVTSMTTALNARMKNAGVTLSAATARKPTSTEAWMLGDDYTPADIVALQGYGQSTELAEPDLVASIIRRGTTGNKVADNVLRSSKATTLDDLFADIDWGKNVYDPMTKTGTAASEFETSLTSALKSVDDAIKKAKELGLAEDVLRSKRKEAIDAAYAARDRTVLNTTLDLDARAANARGTYSGADALYRFDVSAKQQVEDFAKQLKDLGLAAAQADPLMAKLKATLGEERVVTARNAARADEDKAITKANAYTAVDIDTFSSTGRGNTAAQMQFEQQGQAALLALKRSLEDLGYSAGDVANRMVEATANLNTARKRLLEDQAIALASLNGGLVDRYQTAVGTYDDVNNQLARLERQHAAERIQVARQEGADLAQLEATQAAERAAVIKAAGEKVLATGQGIRSFLDGLQTSTSSGRTARQGLENASLLFERDKALAASGDEGAVSRITTTAQGLLEAASAVYGSGKGFADIRAYVESALGGLPQTVAYDAQTVKLLEEANATGIAQKVQLAAIAARAGGEAGAGIVKAAVDAGYGATIAALSTGNQQSWSVAASLSAAQILADVGATNACATAVTTSLSSVGAQIVANDNVSSGTVVSAVGGLQVVMTGIGLSIGTASDRVAVLAGDLTQVAVNTAAAVGAVRDLSGVLSGSTNPILDLIKDGVTRVGQTLSSGIKVFGNFTTGRTSDEPDVSTQQGGGDGGNGNGAGGNGASGDSTGGASSSSSSSDSSSDSGTGGDAGAAGDGGAGDGGSGGDGDWRGRAYWRGWPMQAYAKGGTFTNTIVTEPTNFRRMDGHLGLMGEKTPEAIMPLLGQAGGYGVRSIRPDGTEGVVGLARSASGHLAVRVEGAALYALGDGFDRMGGLGIRGSDAPLSSGRGSAGMGGSDAMLAELRGLRGDVASLEARVGQLQAERRADAGALYDVQERGAAAAEKTSRGVDGLRAETRQARSAPPGARAA